MFHPDPARNCPKHVEFYSKNKFEELVHVVSFIIRTCLHFLFIYLFFNCIADKVHKLKVSACLMVLTALLKHSWC